jgi:hypothetical protein
MRGGHAGEPWDESGELSYGDGTGRRTGLPARSGGAGEGGGVAWSNGEGSGTGCRLEP